MVYKLRLNTAVINKAKKYKEGLIYSEDILHYISLIFEHLNVFS